MFYLVFCLFCVHQCFTSPGATHPTAADRPAVVWCCAAAGSEPIYDLLDALVTTSGPHSRSEIYPILSDNLDMFRVIADDILPDKQQVITSPVQAYQKLIAIVAELRKPISSTHDATHTSHLRVDLEFAEQIPLLANLARVGDKKYVMQMIKRDPVAFMHTLINKYNAPKTNQEITVESCYEALLRLEIEEEED